MYYKVAVIDPIGGHGGLNYYDFSLCKSLMKFGIVPKLYTSDETKVSGEEGFEIITSFHGIYGTSPKYIRGVRFVIGAIKSLIVSRFSGCCVAHFQFFGFGMFECMFILFARLFMFNVVITAHDVKSLGTKSTVWRYFGWLYAFSDAVIVHNEISKNELIRFSGIDNSKIWVIKHGNYLDYVPCDINKTIARSAINISNDEFVILFFGHISDIKGLDVLIKSIPHVIDSVRYKVRLIIAGRALKNDFAKYYDLINKTSIQDVCDLHVRYIDDEEVSDFYVSADVIILPYRHIYQSGVLLMAMSYAKPVIVSNIPGMLEVVTDGINGLVFESENHRDLAQKIIQAASELESLAEMGQRGYEMMKTQYSWEKVGQETGICYQSILSKRK